MNKSISYETQLKNSVHKCLRKFENVCQLYPPLLQHAARIHSMPLITDMTS